MTTERLDPRINVWLDAGPVGAPPVSFDAIMAAVDTMAQEPRRPRVGGRVLPVTGPRLLLVAAAVLVAVAASGYVLRDEIARVAMPRDPSSLLYPYPETQTISERSGGPAVDSEPVLITTLKQEAAWVVVASCTGGGSMTVDVWDRSVVFEGGTEGPEAMPNDRLPVSCDGAPASMRVATLNAFGGDDGVELHHEVVLVPQAGQSWRVAVGEVTDLEDAPSFPALETSDGALVLNDLVEPLLVRSQTGGGIGVQVPAGVTTVTALVQCLGAPVTISLHDGTALGTVDCTDPAVTHRLDAPAEDGMSLLTASDGFTWVRLAAEAVPPAAAQRPEAPALPDGLADVRFAEGDQSNVAFGTLGGNIQTVLPLGASPAGAAAGDTVVLGRADGTGGSLELWSVSDAAKLRTIATVDDGAFFGAWVDPTHEQVFYGVIERVGDEQAGSLHRVGFDGTGDVVITAAQPIEQATFAQQVLAVDDSAFVAHWCLGGTCERTVYDTETGGIRRTNPAGDAPCDLIGAVDGRLVLSTTAACDGPDRRAIVSQALDGSDMVTIGEGLAGGRVVDAADGPGVVLFDHVGETRTTISIAPLDGSGVRELWTAEHQPGFQYSPTSVRLPAGDWILVGGPVGDTPGFAAMGRPIPVLLNVVTGERIELPNLPYSE
jgi:hypothetical protein